MSGESPNRLEKIDSVALELLIKQQQVIEGLRGFGACLAAAVDAEETPNGDRVDYMVRCFADQLAGKNDELVLFLDR